MIVGVDADQTQTDPTAPMSSDIGSLMDSTVKQVIKTAMDGTFAGGLMVGTLANGGVGCALPQA